jgi:uncharacterized protein
VSDIETWFREILCCPKCQATLRDGTDSAGEQALICTGEQCALSYRIDHGIPVLLVDQARAN